MGKLETTSVSIGSLAERVRDGGLELPEIQRSFVWNRPQVRDLLDSLYRGFPVGTLLFWRAGDLDYSRDIESEAASSTQDRSPDFVLDGQQRLTALSRVIYDEDPDIRFNIETEQFEVANAAIKRDPQWIPVTDVFQRGAVDVATERDLITGEDAKELLRRLSHLEHIKDITVPVHIGFDYDEVTEIFVRVNSKGTRLRQSELAIARLAFRLPGMVTEELKSFEEELDNSGYDIDLRFLVRCLTAVATGQSRFPALGNVEPDALRKAWVDTRKGIEYFLNLAKQNLGLESWDWVTSNNTLVLPVAYLAQRPMDDVEVNALLRWFLLSSTWQRYSGSAETRMDQDLRVLRDGPSPFAALERQLLQEVGRLEVTAHISKTPPKEYLPQIEAARLEQQFVPIDPALWEIDAYQDFLQQRRELLAAGINRVLKSYA